MVKWNLKWLQIPKGSVKYVKGEEVRDFKQLWSCFITRADTKSCLIRKLKLSEQISNVFLKWKGLNKWNPIDCMWDSVVGDANTGFLHVDSCSRFHLFVKK